MIAFLVGLAAGLVIGFVIGALWMVAQEARYKAKLYEWWSYQSRLDREDDDEH